LNPRTELVALIIVLALLVVAVLYGVWYYA
jgi:hypothetical protein